MMNKETKGITLIALVITIIILLILAGITLTLVLGENGIITKAQEAKQKTEQARIEEQVSLAYLEAKAMEGQYVESKGVNSPVLGEAMVPVDGEGNPITSYEEWFDYKDQGPVGTDGKTSKWANAKSKDGSMWVWIPRYAYSIKSGYHCNGLTKNEAGTTNEAGEIDVVFLQGTSDVASDGVTKIERNPTLNNVDSGQATAMTNYVVHPSFTNQVEKGGWDKELAGFWVAKYEASRKDATADNEGIEDAIQSKANSLCWRKINENSIFVKCKKMNESGNICGFLETDMPHQMKNSEWGAVVYLTHSKYGRNKNKILQNNTGYVTGKKDISLDTTTTGNQYGIYDINGGAWEYVASYHNKITSSDMSELVNSRELKYKDVYSLYDNNRFGDAMFETSSQISNESKQFSGYKNASVGLDYMIVRGGRYSDSNERSGSFFYSIANGGENDEGSFRVVIIM